MNHDEDEHGDNEAHNNPNMRDDDGADDRDYGYDQSRDNGAGALQGSGSGVLSDGRPPPLNVGQDNMADPQAAAAANVPSQVPNGDELDPIGKWAVILAKGYGTAQRWKVTAPGAAFPDAWCKQKVRDGFYITAVGGRGGKHKPSQQWVVVCTKGIMPGGAQSWRWTGWGDGFPNEWAQKKYDAGLRLTTVGCTAGRWCVVMSTPPKGAKVKQWWAWRDSWANLFEWIKPKLVKGSCVTELAATGKHCFACVTHTDNTEKLKYFWKYDATFPSKDLVTKCDNGYVVECLAGGMGKWAIAAHSGAWTNIHQRWLYNADSFDKFYEKHKDEGFRILAIDGMKG